MAKFTKKKTKSGLLVLLIVLANSVPVLLTFADTLVVRLDVDGGQVLDPLSCLWEPSVSLMGRGYPRSVISHASMSVIDDFTGDISMSGGRFIVELHPWVFESPDGAIDNYLPYLEIILANRGNPLVRIVGTPPYLLDPQIIEDHPQTYMGYPAQDMEGWRELVYNILKYLVIEGETVSDPHLFAGDSTPVPTLGLGDDMLFGFWHGVGGPDYFEWRGTREELFTQWDYTVQAANQLEADYPGTDIQLGGMAWHATPELNHFWDGGLVEQWLAYSADHGLEVDFIDFTYSDMFPFGLYLPLPAFPSRDFVGNTREYLTENGFDPSTPIFNTYWMAPQNVKGEVSGRGYPLRGAELHSHMMATLVPQRILDMELAGLAGHVREGIQDWNPTEIPYPFLKDIMEDGEPTSGMGIYTIGQESEDWLGLRKPEFNAWKMIDMLKETRVYAKSSLSYNNDLAVCVVATKDLQTGDMAILMWHFVNPFQDGNFYPDYSELLESLDPVSAQLTVSGLSPDTLYKITTYVVAESIGNSFTNRFEIEEEYLAGATIEEINNSPKNNLGIIDQGFFQGETLERTFVLEPYSVMLVLLENQMSDIIDHEILYPHHSKGPIGSYQNSPNPFKRTTDITFLVAGSENNYNLSLYDSQGRLVRELLNRDLVPGTYSIVWDGKDSQDRPCASGTYFYLIKTGAHQVSEMMTLIK